MPTSLRKAGWWGWRMSRVSMVLATLGVAIFTLALAVPVQSAARVSGSIGSPHPVDGTAALTIGSEPDLMDGTAALLIGPGPEPLVIATLPASPAASPVPEPPVAVLGSATGPGGQVIASWYGPGFYGNHTACGQVYTPEILGVAHRTLPCGTMLRLEFGGRAVVVPVIDRGPFIAGRTLDLSNATRAALGCSDLCPVWMQ